jgi:uncharacterized lipoprotein YajG
MADLAKMILKIRNLLIFALLFLSACQYQSQIVQIDQKTSPFKINQYYNKKLNLKIIDSRKNKQFIGFRKGVNVWNFDPDYKKEDYFTNPKDSFSKEKAKLTFEDDLAKIVGQKLGENLKKRGLKIKRFTVNQVRVKIIELSFIPTLYRHGAFSVIKVSAKNSDKNFSKIYKKRIVSKKPMIGALILGPFDTGLSDGHNNQMISRALDENIADIVKDKQLWNFLE